MSAERDLLGELVRAAGRRHEPPEGDYEHVLLCARATWQRKVRARKRRQWLLAAAAIAVATFAGVALMQWVPHRSPPLLASAVLVHSDTQVLLPGGDTWQPLETSLRVPAGARVRTGSRGGAALELRAGTSVRLKRESEMTLAAAEVLRLDAGAVYVDTGRQSATGSLRIDTNIGSVRDIGTIFEVAATRDTLRVRVREGQVKLRLAAPEASREVAGRQGEEVEVDRSGLLLRREPFSRQSPAWTWAEALAVAPRIEGLPLMQLLSWVARETGRQLKFDAPATEAQARSIILHGTASGLAPFDALDLLLSTTDLEYTLPTDEVIVIRQRRE